MRSGLQRLRVWLFRGCQQSRGLNDSPAPAGNMSASLVQGKHGPLPATFEPIPLKDIQDSMDRSIDKFALTCGGKGLITIDFDATIIQVHTYGRWSGGAGALAAHVRPVFTALLQKAVPMDNLSVAVVTFSGQIGLIREVLGIVLGSAEMAQKVHIRGNDGSWPMPRDTPSDGKLPHIASVIDAIRELNPDAVPETRDHVMLIDDDLRNIRHADAYGYRSVAFPNLPLPGIHMHSRQSADGLNVLHRTQLRHGALLCISTGSVVAFNGHFKGAIVNAANEGGLGGGGVDGAISRGGGDALYQARLALPEVRKGVRIPTGTARLTGPAKFGSLKVPIVIHAVGPSYVGLEPDEFVEGDNLLTRAYTSSMECAKEAEVELIAFSLISAGVFRGPRGLRDVLGIAVNALIRSSFEGLREVHLVAFNTAETECLLDIVASIEQSDSHLIGSGGSVELKEYLRKFEDVCTAP